MRILGGEMSSLYSMGMTGMKREQKEKGINPSIHSFSSTSSTSGFESSEILHLV